MRRLTALLLVALVLVGLATAPSSADPRHSIGFSRDGKTWSDNLGAPLFDPAVRWVPGDVRQVRFWVRNERPDAGRLRLAVLDSTRDALRETGDLRVAARVGSHRWTSVTAAGTEVLADRLLIRGRERAVPVRIRVRFLPEATNATMRLPADLGFRVVLTDARAVAAVEGTLPEGSAAAGSGSAPGSAGASPSSTPAGSATGAGTASATSGTTTDAATAATEPSADDAVSGPTSDAAGDLPATGSLVPGWTTPAALLLIALGALLLARRRPDAEPSEARRG